MRKAVWSRRAACTINRSLVDRWWNEVIHQVAQFVRLPLNWMDSLGWNYRPPSLNDAARWPVVEFYKAVISSRVSISRSPVLTGLALIQSNSIAFVGCGGRWRWNMLTTFPFGCGFFNGRLLTYIGILLRKSWCRNLNGMDGTIRM